MAVARDAEITFEDPPKEPAVSTIPLCGVDHAPN
jgi:hypothetical protein